MQKVALILLLALAACRSNVVVVRNPAHLPRDQWPVIEQQLRAGQPTLFIGRRPFTAPPQRDLPVTPLTGEWRVENDFNNFRDWAYRSLDGLNGPAGNTLVFSVAGGTNTSRLVVLAVEDDGAHWHFVAGITTQPKRFVVHEKQFHYFYGGQKRDHLSLARVKKLAFGLNMHLAPQAPGAHSFTLNDVGVANDPQPFIDYPDIPLISPPYRQGIARARGEGAPYRWMPLAENAVMFWEPNGRRYVWIDADRPPASLVRDAVARLATNFVPPTLPPLVVPEPVAEDWVTVDGAYLSYRNERIFLKGVNYWPLNHNGKAPGEFNPHWLEPSVFDPEIILRDLDRLRQLGVNAVSIQYHEESQAPQLKWFVHECRQRGIWVHCFVGSLQPLDQNLPKARRLIEAAGFKDLPGVFAFDVAWEPFLGNYPQRCRFDDEWEQWIVATYGSVDEAEVAIGRPLWNRDGRLTGPSDRELSTDGPHRVAVAAYRRFVDEYMGRRYGEVKEFVRGLGCRQLLSARSGYGGNGNPWADPLMPVDLAAGAEHFDFISPEAYALTGDLDQFFEGGFITAYARGVGHGKPVVWMEYGVSVNDEPQAPDLENQARLYRNMLEMVKRSHAAGCFAWWYPGGWRVDERSDYGIVNVDGSLRPAAEVLRDFVPRLAPPRPWSGRTIDRDADARGLSALWDKWRDVYRQELAEDQMEEVRLETSTPQE